MPHPRLAPAAVQVLGRPRSGAQRRALSALLRRVGDHVIVPRICLDTKVDVLVVLSRFPEPRIRGDGWARAAHHPALVLIVWPNGDLATAWPAKSNALRTIQ